MKNNLIDIILRAALNKWRVKVLLILGALVLSVAVIFFANYLAENIIAREKGSIEFYAKVFIHYANTNESNAEDIDFFLYEIAPTISFPVIMTDKDDEPLSMIDPITNDTIYSEYVLNITLNPKQKPWQQRAYLKALLKEMSARSKDYPPISVIQESDGTVLQKLHYTQSNIITYIKYFPWVAIFVMMVFIIIGYMAFNYFRRSQESKVWVGMAKEAAHQLGTPLSSILAWIEIMKMNSSDPNMIEEYLGEMQNDIDRLNKITVRFSKIGSMPEMKKENLAELIEFVTVYFEKRLPNLGKKIGIQKNLDYSIVTMLNHDLMEWVFENLIKNAAESIDSKDGIVEISLYNTRKMIQVQVRDNGKGMNNFIRRQAFNPGFTTKKRGWGLGLSLTKRIVEEYHKGRIYIKESIPGKGTTFIVELPHSSKIN